MDSIELNDDLNSELNNEFNIDFDIDHNEDNFEDPIDKSTYPWIEKYRPVKLDQVISHTQIMNTLRNFMKSGNMPHMLFYGPSGTGKTSAIISCAKELYNDYFNFMVLELNASDNRGIEMVRQKIKRFASGRNEFFLPKELQNNVYKLIILDETDGITFDAQAILRQIIENYSDTTRFCLICNYINKIRPALQSRCTRFRFVPLIATDMAKKLNEIALIEKLKFDQNAINAIIKVTGGDMRKAINLLQSAHLTYDVITSNKIFECSGYCKPDDVIFIYSILLKCSKSTIKFSIAYEQVRDKIHNNNLSIYNILNEIKNNVLNNNEDDLYKINIIDKLGQLETYIAVNIDTEMQILNLISIFYEIQINDKHLNDKNKKLIKKQ
jgi:DNA polymerase III delta prime subunit